MAKRILVIDDEERIREVVRACLEDLAGWEVVTAGSGQDGLVQAKLPGIDVILVDVSMPEMDGITFFKQLQTDRMTRSIPVIFLTAKMLPADREKFAELGIAGVISKPFDPVGISEQIAELLGWH